MTCILLASASPRRAELLAASGIDFEIRPAHVDERLKPGELAADYVQRVAEAKALAIAQEAPGRAVLAADTAVVVDEEVLGKPQDRADAARMLRLLSGRSHTVLTAVTLAVPSKDPACRGSAPSPLSQPAQDPSSTAEAFGDVEVDTRVAATAVEFAPLTEEEIDGYVASGEPADKAGAYGIQGRASRFVTRIEGSYTNVVGLPMALVYQMCTRAGILIS